MELPSLSIVIPTYNGLDHLERCLASVVRHAPRDAQIIVVDDASTDGTVPWLRERFSLVEVIALETNQGFCGAVNAGVAHARGEVVELLNNDTEVTAGWAEAALRHFSDPSIGSVAPLVLFHDRPDVIDSAGQEYHLCGWGVNRFYGQKLEQHHLQIAEVFGPSGSSGFYRRSALERTGVLLPEYGAYYEDVDLSFRLRWAGFRCLFEPASRVYHRESATYRKQKVRVVGLLARNEELVFWINLHWPHLLLGLVPHLGFVAIRAIRKTMQKQGRVFWAAKWDAVRRWRWIIERRRQLHRIAREARKPVDLIISHDPQVLRAGWDWMTRRKSA